MRFTPIGLVVISTVLGNKGAYLTPALMFALIDTVVPFLAGAEIGRRFLRAGVKRTPPPESHPSGPAPEMTGSGA
ncbi:hypothetical protein AAIB33_05920 [Microbacterium sp. AZCO]|uniref:hypothetical protein n=1 Tax=Microbacterium sp. AZCO TaxID=3142976 RepID=UPI0031F38A99